MESLKKLDELIEYVDEMFKAQPPKKIVRRHRRTMTIKAWDNEQSNTIIAEDISIPKTEDNSINNSGQPDIHQDGIDPVQLSRMKDNASDILNNSQEIGATDRMSSLVQITEKDNESELFNQKGKSSTAIVKLSDKETSLTVYNELQSKVTHEDSGYTVRQSRTEICGDSEVSVKLQLNDNTKLPSFEYKLVNTTNKDAIEENSDHQSVKTPIFEYKLTNNTSSVKIVDNIICIRPDPNQNKKILRRSPSASSFMKHVKSRRHSKSDLNSFDTSSSNEDTGKEKSIIPAHSIDERLIDCRTTSNLLGIKDQEIPVSFISDERSFKCSERNLIEDIMKIVSHGDLEMDLRLIDILENIIEKLEKSKDSFTCKVAVNIAICKKYVQDFIELKKIIGNFANMKL